MLSSEMRWNISQADERLVEQLQAELGLSGLMAKLMAARGWTTREAKQMLRIEQEAFHDPFAMDDMAAAVRRIETAVEQQEYIRIYGDYDCDGVSSTTIMYKGLLEYGARVDYYIPDRFREGYGLNKAALEKAKEDGVNLLITVDTGISGRDEVDYGQKIGLDIIVTDHHEPPPELPECTAVINPKKPGCTYPFKDLAGAGVALKVVQALLGRVPHEWLDFASIGTIADLVPLVDENRLIAYYGLQSLNRTCHVGLKALIDKAQLAGKRLDEQHIGFALGPRINACGRLRHAESAVELLLTEDAGRAEELARELDALNQERQALVKQTFAEAVQWMEDRYDTDHPRVIVVAQPNWHEGILGIVASRLVERYYVPTIVLTIDTETQTAKGSARSIEGFDIYKALFECRDLLSQFGGHPMAAGMTLKADDVEALRAKLVQLAEQWLTEEDLKPVLHVDVTVDLKDMTLEAVEDLGTLAPYGVGNPKPLLVLEKNSLQEWRTVGADDKHLKCRLAGNGVRLDGIGFNMGDRMEKVSPMANVDIVGEADVNEWNGNRKPQILIRDLRVVERQFFDWRGKRSLLEDWRQSYDEHGAVLCTFRPAHSVLTELEPLFAVWAEEQQTGRDIQAPPWQWYPFNLSGHLEPLSAEISRSTPLGHFGHRHQDAPAIAYAETAAVQDSFTDVKADTFILYDLPRSMDQFEQAMQLMGHGKRFYLVFKQEEEHFLSTIPTREHFRWYYAFLRQKGRFDVNRDAPRLAKHKGWTVDAIQFMTQVFLELGFATIEQGEVRLSGSPAKRSLAESDVYRQKQQALQVEEMLVYASYKDVVQLCRQLLPENE